MNWRLTSQSGKFKYDANGGTCKGYVLDWIVPTVNNPAFPKDELLAAWFLTIDYASYGDSATERKKRSVAFLRKWEDRFGIPVDDRCVVDDGVKPCTIAFPGSFWMRSPTLLSGLMLIVRSGQVVPLTQTLEDLPKLFHAKSLLLDAYIWRECFQIPGRFSRMLAGDTSHLLKPWNSYWTGTHGIGLGQNNGEV